MDKIFLSFCLIVLLSGLPAALQAQDGAADEAGDAAAEEEVVEEEPQPQPSPVTGAVRAQPAAVTPAAQAQQQPAGVTAAAETAGMTKMEKYFYYGDRYFAAKDYASAVKYYFAATKLEPGNLQAWKKTAFCYYQMKKHNYAYASFQRVLKIDKNDKDALQFMEFYGNVMETNRKKAEKREMIDPLWRSLVFPGWGQFHNNQAGKAIMIGGGFIATVGLTVFNIADEKSKYDKYLKANENWEIAYKEAQDAWTSALVWGIVSGVIYAAGAADAALNYNCDEARTAFLDYRGDALYLCASVRW